MTALDDATAAKSHVLDEIEHKQRTDGSRAAGLEVLGRYAATRQPFSANTVRAELAAVGVKHSASLFRSACRIGLLRACGYEASDKDGTNAAVVKQYICAGITVSPDAGDAAPTPTDEAPGSWVDLYGIDPLFDVDGRAVS